MSPFRAAPPCKLALALAFALASIAAASAKPLVAVSILPQAEFVRRIAGDSVAILVLVGPGASPHSFEPSPRQMAELSKAKIWFSLGVDFEKALKPKIAKLYPALRIVDTSAKVAFRSLEEHHHDEAGDESPGGSGAAGGGDAPGGRDQHIWLGREAVKAQLGVILPSLQALVPTQASAFASRHAAFRDEIDRVFEALKAELASRRGEKVFVFHPSFGYFLDEFGLVQEAVEAGGKEPTQRVLAELIKSAKAEGARTIFVQKQFPSAAAKTVAAAIGGKVVEVDPLAENWLENIRLMGDALKGGK
ncbi:MAG TPA: zinc ABC transporter substrate-binding protein [Rectinemataceae bacterium]